VIGRSNKYGSLNDGDNSAPAILCSETPTRFASAQEVRGLERLPKKPSNCERPPRTQRVAVLLGELQLDVDARPVRAAGR
jgi:hypothetical protein